MNQTEFYRFKLIDNSVNPACAWSQDKNWTNKIVKDGNWGIPCGDKNYITVLDLDTDHWEDKHIFIKTFGEKYVDSFNTYTVKTKNGGYHLYFKYDPELTSTVNTNLHIDIKSNGGYVVAPGSSVNGKRYTIFKNSCVKKIPDVLKDFLVDYVYCKKVNKNKQKSNNANNDRLLCEYYYTIPDNDIRVIINKNITGGFISLDSYMDWFKFTTFCKILECNQIWDEYSRQSKRYNRENNEIIWNGINGSIDHSIVEYFLKNADMLRNLPYYRYKPICNAMKKPHVVIDKDKLGYDYFDDKRNYVVKSDTGTGKTTSFKHYISNMNNHKFISICSRVSLCMEQYRIFSEHGIECSLYMYETTIHDNSLIIQIDSLSRASNINYNGYIVFMDEFSSTLEHLIMSPTLNKIRLNVFRVLVKILKTAKQIIFTDADISENCFRFLEYVEVDYVYHENIYKHCNGVVSKEIHYRSDLINALKSDDKFIVCCDSKSECKSIYADLKDTTVKLITSDNDSRTEIINLDEYDKIIFSPKIIYGLDSTMRRNVYCVYKSSSISPKHMVQQVNRCRNIISINYIFPNKTVRDSTYKCRKDVYDRLIALKNIDIDGFVDDCTYDENKIYLYMLTAYEYNNDCYRTNKFIHFKNILRERGVVDVDYIKKTSKYGFLSYQDIIARDITNFDPNSSVVSMKNEYLHVPSDQLYNYAEYFIDTKLLHNHWNISNFFFKDKLLSQSIIDKIDFKVNVVRSSEHKLKFLSDLIEKSGIKYDNKFTIDKNLLSDKDAAEMSNIYMKLFGRKKENICFKNNYKLISHVCGIFKKMFGGNIVNSKRARVNGNLIYEYYLNNDMIEKERTLFEFRNKKIDDIDNDL